MKQIIHFIKKKELHLVVDKKYFNYQIVQLP